MERVAEKVMRRILAREVRITVLRDETMKARQGGAEALVARFESPISLYRVFDGEELRRIVATGKITGGTYSVATERAYGASWGEDISDVIAFGNRQRGHRLGDDLFLAKIDAQGKKFYRMSMKDVPCDPEGPEEQPSSMDASKCNSGLGCSTLDVSFNDATYYHVGTTNHIDPISDAEIHAYLKSKPQKPVELRDVSPVFLQGTILGVDVRVKMNQDHIKNKVVSEFAPGYIQGPYYDTWQVETRDAVPFIMGAKTKEIAVKWAAKLIKAGQVSTTHPVDLLPVSKRKKWDKMHARPEVYAAHTAKIYVGSVSASALRVAARSIAEEGPTMSKRVAARHFIARNFFEVDDVVLYGKYKNHRGRILNFGVDHWGNPTVTIEPIPRGRKQPKTFGLYKMWRADIKETALREQAEQAAAEGGAP